MRRGARHRIGTRFSSITNVAMNFHRFTRVALIRYPANGIQLGGRGKGGEGGEALASADDFNTMPAAYNPPPIFRNRSGNDHQYE